MLLTIVFGLIAKLMLVSEGCDVGTTKVKQFNWNQFTGTWYVLLHTPNDFENNYNCVVLYHGRPEGNISLSTLQLIHISEQRTVTFSGNATNWSSTGYDQIVPEPSIWSGRFYVVAIDYNRYKIFKHCPFQSNQPYVYVSFRKQHPDKQTMVDVLNDLKENNIDVSQLVDWPADNCQQGELSTKKGRSA